MSLGSNIRKKRIDKGLSQEILAERLHVSQATLSNIEAEKSFPDIFMLQRIAELLNTDIGSLLENKTIIINNDNQTGGIGYAEVVNQLSEKLIELYEKKIHDKDRIIEDLKKKLNSFKD